jgi:Flp pilus assembly protein TadB
MSARRSSGRPRRRDDGVLTPDTGVRMSLTQVGLFGAGIFVVAVGYAFMVWNQTSTSKDVSDIKTTQASSLITLQTVARDQEEKRQALAQEFIKSNQKIADSIGQLTTLTAVTQERQKASDEKLERVLGQIGTALQPKAR